MVYIGNQKSQPDDGSRQRKIEPAREMPIAVRRFWRCFTPLGSSVVCARKHGELSLSLSRRLTSVFCALTNNVHT